MRPCSNTCRLVRVLRDAQDDTADSTPGDNPEWRPGVAEQLFPATVDGSRKGNGEHWTLRVATPQAGFAVLRLMDFPSWQVKVDGLTTIAAPQTRGWPGGGAVERREPSNSGGLDRNHRRIVAGRSLSVAALVVLAGVAVWERKGPRGRSSMITQMQATVHEILGNGAACIDRALDRLLPRADQPPVSIHQAVRHSVFAGGKRLRPVLCMEAARMIAAHAEPVAFGG